jgi:hypothetical protein
MPRPKQYATTAERARAWRLRQTAQQQDTAATTGTIPTTKKKRQPSRPARIAALESLAQALHDEYSSWHEAMPESLENTSAAEKVAECVETLATILELIQSLDPPLGFGRD